MLVRRPLEQVRPQVLVALRVLRLALPLVQAGQLVLLVEQLPELVRQELQEPQQPVGLQGLGPLALARQEPQRLEEWLEQLRPHQRWLGRLRLQRSRPLEP